MGNQLKQLHDELLAHKPDGAVHDEASCSLCAAVVEEPSKEVSIDDQPEGGSMSDDAKTYTEDDLKAAVEKAVTDKTSELTAKLTELESKNQQSEIDSAVSAAKAESEETISELRTQLDAAVLSAETEKAKREELEASIEADKSAAEEAKALEARKVEVKAAVEELNTFPKEHIEANAERWAKQPVEAFEQQLEDWKLIAKRDETVIPNTTALQASRDEGGNNQGSALSDLGEIRAARAAGL